MKGFDMEFDEHSLFVDHGFTQEEIDAMMKAEQESYCPDWDDDDWDDDRDVDFEYDQDVDFDMYSEW